MSGSGFEPSLSVGRQTKSQRVNLPWAKPAFSLKCCLKLIFFPSSSLLTESIVNIVDKELFSPTSAVATYLSLSGIFVKAKIKESGYKSTGTQLYHDPLVVLDTESAVPPPP